MSKYGRNRVAGVFVGLLSTLLVAAPASADDTELLLVAPTGTDQQKPNILFIIDTSTSMNAQEETPAPYDPTENYSGDCDSGRNYWMEIEGVEPDCSSTTQYTDKDNFYCDAAVNQMNGLGSYSSTFVQYRDGGPDGTGSGPSKWQSLAAGYDAAPVECQADAGEHGDGRPTYLWAKTGSNLADLYTDQSGEEISCTALEPRPTLSMTATTSTTRPTPTS